MPEERRHIAILFSDIVSYTSLMGEDEDKALDMLARNRTIHETHIKQFNGTFIKDIGDAVLGSFSLASDAVRCAIEIQKSCKEDNIPLKIGIHEGEVVFKNSDVFGDGVNIASRLQSDAQQGCINISGSVYRDVKNKSDIRTSYIGEKTFKNVDEPIKVYKILCGDEPSEPSTSNGNEIKRSGKNPYYLIVGIAIITIAILFIWKIIPSRETVELDKSIAVLPFDNESADDDNIYFVNGMMEDIRNNLSKIGDLRVISKTSTEKYRDTKLSTSEIGKELNVSYLLEGTVQKLGNQVKIHAQLISVNNDDHIWEDTYERDISDVTKYFKVQSDIAKIIASELKVSITPQEEQDIETNPTSDLTAYDFYLRGEEYYHRSFKEDDFKYAMKMYQKAIEIDSNYTLAWVRLAGSSRFLYFLYRDRSDERLIQTKQYLDHAIKLNSELFEVQLENASYLYHCERKYNDALKILNKLKSKYPKNAEIYIWMAAIYKRLGEFEKSIEFNNHSINLDPSNWVNWIDAAKVYKFIGNYHNAKECFNKVIELNPSMELTYWNLINLYYLTGELKKLNELLHNYDTPIDSIVLQRIVSLQEGKYEDVIRKVGESSGFNSNYQLGEWYYLASNKEKAIEYFNKEKSLLEKKIETSENDYRLYGKLGIVYAGLGDKAKAINAGEKAIELLNINNDAYDGVRPELNMAMILLMVEEYDEAVLKLEYLLDYTGDISVEYLKNHWRWRGFLKNEQYRALVENPKYQIGSIQRNN